MGLYGLQWLQIWWVLREGNGYDSGVGDGVALARVSDVAMMRGTLEKKALLRNWTSLFPSLSRPESYFDLEALVVYVEVSKTFFLESIWWVSLSPTVSKLVPHPSQTFPFCPSLLSPLFRSLLSLFQSFLHWCAVVLCAFLSLSLWLLFLGIWLVSPVVLFLLAWILCPPLLSRGREQASTSKLRMCS